jgi:hypothetical protein
VVKEEETAKEAEVMEVAAVDYPTWDNNRSPSTELMLPIQTDPSHKMSGIN